MVFRSKGWHCSICAGYAEELLGEFDGQERHQERCPGGCERLPARVQTYVSDLPMPQIVSPFMSATRVVLLLPYARTRMIAAMNPLSYLNVPQYLESQRPPELAAYDCYQIEHSTTHGLGCPRCANMLCQVHPASGPGSVARRSGPQGEYNPLLDIHTVFSCIAASQP